MQSLFEAPQIRRGWYFSRSPAASDSSRAAADL